MSCVYSCLCNLYLPGVLVYALDEPSTDATLSSIMERHATTQNKKESTNSKQDKDKQRLLAKYAEISDGEDCRYPFRPLKNYHNSSLTSVSWRRQEHTSQNVKEITTGSSSEPAKFPKRFNHTVYPQSLLMQLVSSCKASKLTSFETFYFRHPRLAFTFLSFLCFIVKVLTFNHMIPVQLVHKEHKKLTNF